MKVIELHPEELLERDVEALSAQDREHLEAHLKGCAACRLLQRARADFAAERDTMDQLEHDGGLAPAIVGELADRALAELTRSSRSSDSSRRDGDEHGRDDAPSTERTEPRRRQPGSARRWRRVALVAAAVMFTTTAAAATGWLQQLWGWSIAVGELPPAATSMIAEAMPATTKLMTTTAAPTAPVAVKVAPATPASSRPEELIQPPSRLAGMGAATPSPKAETSSTLFGRAASARAAGDYERALRLHRDLQRRYPDSAEARRSRPIIARLLLDTGRAEAALEDYERYLENDGAPLTEEAMVGRALANRQLGRPQQERSAWLGLLQRFPSSVHAAQARARLAALRGNSEE